MRDQSEQIGPAARRLLLRAGATIRQTTRAVANHAQAIQCMIQMIEQSSSREGRAPCIEAIGHRVAPGEVTQISEDDTQLACYVAWIDGEIEIARGMRDCVLKRTS